MLFSGPVPLIVGVVSSELASLTSTLPAPLSSTIEVMTGTSGRSGASTTLKLVGSLTLPAASFATIVRVVSLVCAGERAMEKLPPTAMPRPSSIVVPPGPGPVIITSDPGSAVPVIGVPSIAREVTAGAAGGAVSIVTLVVDVPEVLPAASLEVTVMTCGASFSGVPDVQLQLPSGCTVAVTGDALPSIETVIFVPGSPVPLRVGVLSLLYSTPFARVLSETASICGVVGAMVSTVTV
ncbi:hypothetical protein D3C80_836290 [compost metagenome]